jgi:hypothetical protein
MAEQMVGNRLFQISQAVEKYVRLAQPHFDEENRWRTGGYFCLWDTGHRAPFLVTLIGDPTDEKMMKYYVYSMEKADRLRSNVTQGHRTSFQSRDENKKWFGGAISTPRMILSFSGFQEMWDEAVMLATAVNLRLISRSDAAGIAHGTAVGPLNRLI